MKKNYRTAILLVNYNSSIDTNECIESIINSGENDFFILVVDNGGDQIFQSNLEEDYLKIIRSDTNLGFGRANNLGLAWIMSNINYEYILILNNDTIVSFDSIAKLRRSFDSLPSFSIVTGRIHYNSNRNLVWYGGADINFVRGWPKIADFGKEPSLEGALKSREVEFISGCLMLFSKESIEKVKGFDERFFMYIEDVEMSIRAKNDGCTLYYNSEAKIYHKVQGGGENVGMKTKNPKLEFLLTNMKVNQFITFTTHLRGLRRILFLLTFHIELVIKSVLFYLKGRRDIFKIYSKVLRGIKYAK